MAHGLSVELSEVRKVVWRPAYMPDHDLVEGRIVRSFPRKLRVKRKASRERVLCRVVDANNRKLADMWRKMRLDLIWNAWGPGSLAKRGSGG
jgi:hypothetical protein